jgi:hypothetical protein
MFAIRRSRSSRPSASRSGAGRTSCPGVKPCLEPLEDRFAPAVLPTNMLFTGISTQYTLFNQTDTVTAQITSSPGIAVNEGQVSFTDGGQTHVVAVSNGTASTTFTFPLNAEMPNIHNISATYSDPTPPSPLQSFATTTGQGTVPDSTPNYLSQLGYDLAFFMALGF